MRTDPAFYDGVLKPFWDPAIVSTEALVYRLVELQCDCLIILRLIATESDGRIGLLQLRSNVGLTTQLIERTLRRVRTTSAFSKKSLDRLATPFALALKELKASLIFHQFGLVPVDNVSGLISAPSA